MGVFFATASISSGVNRTVVLTVPPPVALTVKAIAAALAWGIGEVMGYKHSLEHHPWEAPWFYLVYSAGVLGRAILVATVPNRVSLIIAVPVMNALPLPLVIGFLVALAIKALPTEHCRRGSHRWVVNGATILSTGLEVFGALRI